MLGKETKQTSPTAPETEAHLNELDIERMEGEGFTVFSPKGRESVLTPKTEVPTEGWEDETVEGAQERMHLNPQRRAVKAHQNARGCSCDCPRCPEECPPTCICAGHSRHHPSGSLDPVSGDDP